MKVLYFSRSYTPHDHRFLAAIQQGGGQAVFLRLPGEGGSEPRALPAGVQALAWRGSLQAALDEAQPDVLHAGPLDDCAYLAARSRFHPLVAMSWGSDILWTARRNGLKRLRVRKSLRAADALIGDCAVVRQAAENYGMPAEKIVTFPWGIDLQAFNPHNSDGGLRARLGWRDNFVLLHLRSWEAVYDPLTVARAFVLAARQQPRLRLLMPGSGRLEGRLHAIFARAGLQERVRLPGRLSQTDLPEYYRAADLYLSASLSDGSSVSLMEALASGLPALVSDIPGNREWVQPGGQGWLFPAGKPEVLAERILRAAVAKELAGMAAAARRTAEQRADWAHNQQGLFEAYRLAMQGPR